MKNLVKIIKRFPQAKILIVGDLILDEYIWGDVERISPEAPVPVMRAQKRSYTLGGAANVANNIRSLGAAVSVCGIAGRDKNAQILLRELRARGIQSQGVLRVNKRLTTLKTRLIASHQQVVRLDWEQTQPLSAGINERLYDFVNKNIGKFNALVIEDYGKGVINQKLAARVIALAKEKKLLVTVDPKEEHFQYYAQTTAITPNRKEVESALRCLKMQDKNNSFKVNSDRLQDEKDLNRAGKKLLNYLGLEALLITIGEQGMRLFEKNAITHIPTRTQQVFDVSGAGDTVIAAFTLSLACGASRLEAAHIANLCAGIVVSKIGTASASSAELIERIKTLQTNN